MIALAVVFRRERTTGSRFAMSHDKIKKAARERMARTGESYAAARRAVIGQFQAIGGTGRSPDTPGTGWFAISYSDTWTGKLSNSLDRILFRSGRGVSRVEVDERQIRVRMGSFKLDLPRASVRSVRRSAAKVGGTSGVHGRRGRWLVNGSADGLVELEIDPPGRISLSLDTLYGLVPSLVSQLTVSLEDPDGFIAATVGHHRTE
ncbi:MAG TPA: hypothetical protein VN767_13920 [Streptosporangiaceae bacterium]|nr:hypothetical protein [Streptosporangiaceae bacterium]